MKTRLSLLLGLLLTALFPINIHAGKTQPPPPPTPYNPEIAFRDGNYLWGMNADGTNATQILDVRFSSPVGLQQCDWSPDGKRIFFHVNYGFRLGGDGIFSIDRTGQNLEWLLHTEASPKVSPGPVWGLNEPKVAITYYPNAKFRDDIEDSNSAYLADMLDKDIWLVDLTPSGHLEDGTPITGTYNLTNTPFHEDLPSWSPEGDCLATYVKTDYRQSDGLIYVYQLAYDLQGNLTFHPIPVTEAAQSESVFYPTQIKDMIWANRSDAVAVITTSNQIRILQLYPPYANQLVFDAVVSLPGQSLSSLSWAPDDSQLVFTVQVGSQLGKNTRNGVYKISVGGTGLTKLINSSSCWGAKWFRGLQ